MGRSHEPAVRAVLDTEIRNVERSMQRVRSRMDAIEEPFSFPADCCPPCACGPEWKELAEKLERQAFVLARLYLKRGSLGDAPKAERLWLDHGASNAQWRAWRGSKADPQAPKP